MWAAMRFQSRLMGKIFPGQLLYGHRKLLELALEYADRAMVLRNGVCAMEGPARELLASRDLVNSYLS